MSSMTSLPWLKINDFLIDVGKVRDPKRFCMQVIHKIGRLIPYDQARIYFLKDTGQIDDEFLIGVDRSWGKAYRDYYSKIDNNRYAIPNRAYRNYARMREGYYAFPRQGGSVIDWSRYEIGSPEFASNYLQAQRINYTANILFHSADYFIKAVCILDRTSRAEYSLNEIRIMKIIQPHLDNLHCNLFVHTPLNTLITNKQVMNTLTDRELDIANLLVRGLTPKKISSKLSISPATVYRHLANIHQKLKVSNRQELILKLLEA